MNESTQAEPEPNHRAPAPKGSPKAIAMTIASRRHAIPFFIWMGVLLAIQVFNLGDNPDSEYSLGLVSLSSAYAFRTVVCAAVFIALKPWRYYPSLSARNIMPAIGLGAAVFILWTGFESQLFRTALPSVADAYEKWCVMPFGKMREPMESLPYAPDVCGWPLTVMRFIGSAFVISVIEEFFWRGFLYRWTQSLDFLDIDPGVMSLKHFLLVAAIFAFAHVEWAAGLVTGIAYGYFYVKTKDIWAAAIAHITTNLLLGIYVLACGEWIYW